MSLDSETKEIVAAMAKEVIKIYDIRFPINSIDDVVRSMGGVVMEDSSLDGIYNGRIIKSGQDGFIIVVPPFLKKSYRNLNVAHELGHLFLHMGFQTNKERWDAQSRIRYYYNDNIGRECQASAFADALLMPEEKYRKILKHNTEGSLVHTDKIARYFRVPVSAASNRGKDLGYLKW